MFYENQTLTNNENFMSFYLVTWIVCIPILIDQEDIDLELTHCFASLF